MLYPRWSRGARPHWSAPSPSLRILHGLGRDPMTAPATPEEALADLLARGYKPIEDVRGIRVGVRVHHAGERYARAHTEGTATVLHVLEKTPSSWANQWRRRDIEIIVQPDSDSWRAKSRIASVWADYHTGLPECTGCKFGINGCCTCAVLAGGAR